MKVARDFIFDPGLVLYLPLYELDGASFMSEDKHGHLCTVTGALWTPQGRTFDGVDDIIDCGNNSTLYTTPNNQWTMEVWFYPTNTTNWVILGRNYSPASYFIFIWDNAVGASFRLASSNKDTNTMPVVANTWNHYVAQFNGSGTDIWLNGVAGTSNSVVGTLTFANNVDTYIGCRSTDGPFFGGVIGEVRLYNRALSATEVQHNYLATKWRYK